MNRTTRPPAYADGSDFMKNPAIIVMAKVPGFGDVKTRLRPILSEDQCSSLATCFLLDTIANLEASFDNILIAFTPEKALSHLKSLIKSEHKLITQKGNDLGERLKTAIAEAFEMGFAPIIVVGTDSPNMPVDLPAKVLAHLSPRENGVVIGPTEDGGYYLIGVSKQIDDLFNGVTWGANSVFDETISKVNEIGNLDLLILPEWFDVDEPDDLLRLNAELCGTVAEANNTVRWLVENQGVFNATSRVT